MSYSSFSSTLVDATKDKCNFPSEAESGRIISGMRYFGLFSSEKALIRGDNLLDTLCGQLEKLLTFQPGERDLVMLQHKFVVEWQDGKKVGSSEQAVLLRKSELTKRSRRLLLLRLSCWGIQRGTRGCQSRSV